jgi:uncharacterized membrane protein
MTSLTTSVENAPSQAPAKRVAVMLLSGGIAHFAIPKPYDTIVPAELPGSARFYTYASGVAELVAGGMLLVPRTRRLGALAAVALLVAVFPANLNTVRLWWNKGWPARIGTIARLPLQWPMITQALKAYRNAPR